MPSIVPGVPTGPASPFATTTEVDALEASLLAELAIAPFPSASLVTQGLYARTQPTPDTGSASIRPLAVDPNVSGRVWAIGTAFAQIGYTDDHGATFTPKVTVGQSGVQQLLFANNYLWALTAPGTAKNGRLYRSPQPDSSGNGISWTLMFDLAAPYGALSSGDQSSFRHNCVAVSGANVYLLEYSIATITGGPSLFYSADSGATWTKPKTWSNGKHGHAVKVIGGVPWVTIGDATFTDLGFYNATTAAAGTWNRRSLYTETADGNTLYGINFYPITMSGQSVIALEYDGNRNWGPLIFPTQSISSTKAMQPTFQMPAPYQGSMRGLVLTTEGNLMWVHTGENAALGPLDSIWISKPPFNTATLLESFASDNTLGTIGETVEDGAYVWFGTYRITKEKFIGQ